MHPMNFGTVSHDNTWHAAGEKCSNFNTLVINSVQLKVKEQQLNLDQPGAGLHPTASILTTLLVLPIELNHSISDRKHKDSQIF